MLYYTSFQGSTMLTGPGVLQWKKIILEPSVFIPRGGHSRTFQLEGIIYIYFYGWSYSDKNWIQPLRLALSRFEDQSGFSWLGHIITVESDGWSPSWDQNHSWMDSMDRFFFAENQCWEQKESRE